MLLSIVALQPGAYGNSVVEHINRLADYEPIGASVYVAIGGLEKKGLLKPRDGKPRAIQSGRGVRFWSVTPKGKAEISKWLNRLPWLAAAAGYEAFLTTPG